MDKRFPIFSSQRESIVREGLYFWTINNYRNYLVGTTTLPAFVGEYMPQQTHFDSLFQLLFYKKAIVSIYINRVKSIVEEIENEKAKIDGSYTAKKLTFENDIDKGLEVLQKWYLSKDFTTIGNFSNSFDYLSIRTQLLLLGKEESKEQEKNDCRWSVGSFSNSDYTYSSIAYQGNRQRRSSMYFFKNATTPSDGDSSYVVTLQRAETLQINEIEKHIYRGFSSFDGSSTISVEADQPFKCMLDIPFRGYVIKIKNQSNQEVESQILKNNHPICIGQGYLHSRKDWNSTSYTGREFFEVGELVDGRTSRKIKNIGEKREIYIDKETVKMLGGNDTGISVEIQEVEYTYRHSFVGSRDSSLRSHTHSFSHNAHGKVF